MKILFFTHIIPYPLDEGGKTSQFFLLKELAKSEEVAVIFQSFSKYDDERIGNFKKSIPDLAVFTIDMHSAIGVDSIIVRLGKALVWEITKRLPKENSSVTGNANFIDPVRIFDERFVSQFANILDQFQPDIVQVDFIDNAGAVYLIPENVKKVLVIHDFRFQNVPPVSSANNFTKLYEDYLIKYVSTKEWCVANFFDKCIVFSLNAQTTAINLGLKNVAVSPFTVSENSSIVNDSNPMIANVVLLGPDHHYPNLDALEWYATHLAERIKANFDLNTIVIGKWQVRNQEKFKKYPMIKFLGFVGDLEKQMAESILLVPLRIGSGIRTKILDAFRLGVPVISSAIGIEGINAINGIHYYEAEHADEYVNAIESLISSPDELKKMRISAKKYFDDNFSLKLVVQSRLKLFEELLNTNFK